MATTLPTDLTTEILSRLPVKSLLRFTCVCKCWYSLIRTPNFIKLHLNQTLTSNSDRHLLLTFSSIHSAELDINHNQLSFIEHDHPIKSRKVDFIGSCNGIVCIVYGEHDVYLYNPLTNSHRKLPPNHFPELANMTLVYGFGYDSKNDDYKVLRLLQDSLYKIFYNEAKVYSLRNNSWKSVESFPHIPYFMHKHPVLFNEALHYIVFKQELGMQYQFIASFDLRTETYSLIDCPNFDDKFRDDLLMLLCALGGCFCMLVNYPTIKPVRPTWLPDRRENGMDRFDLWVMKEYGKKESWVRLFSIRQMESVGIGSRIRPVVYSKDRRKILFEVDGLKLGWYDLKNKSFERFTTKRLPKPPFVAGFFVGSLVSLADDKLQSKGGTTRRKNTKKQWFKLKL